MTSTPISRQPHRRAGEDPSLPAAVRWYLLVTRYVRDPLTLRRRAPTSTVRQLASLGLEDEARMAPPLLAYLSDCERSLRALGFAEPVRGINRSHRNLRSCFSLVEHPADGAIGYILVAEGMRIGGRLYATVTFRNDFADGVQLATTNSQTTPRAPRRPRIETAHFRDVHDAAALYELHRFRVAERARRVAVVPLTRAPDPIAFQEREAAEVYEFWVRKGYYERVGWEAIRPHAPRSAARRAPRTLSLEADHRLAVHADRTPHSRPVPAAAFVNAARGLSRPRSVTRPRER